jgi:hypothetical protein
MRAVEFAHVAFGAIQDELDYAYAVKVDKEKKRTACAKTKGVKALNMLIAQALLTKKGQWHLIVLYRALRAAFELKSFI